MSDPRGASARPATYLIEVYGHIESNWSPRLGGLRIDSQEDQEGVVTTLCGGVPDQAALFGVLNTLYSLGLPLRTVERLPRSQESQRRSSEQASRLESNRAQIE